MRRFLLIALGASLLIPTFARADSFREWKERCIRVAHENGIRNRIMFSPIQLERTCPRTAKASENNDVVVSPYWCPKYNVIDIDVMNKTFRERWD